MEHKTTKQLYAMQRLGRVASTEQDTGDDV
jgi:hypothetical protein